MSTKDTEQEKKVSAEAKAAPSEANLKRVTFIVGREGGYHNGTLHQPGDKVAIEPGELPSRTWEATDQDGLELLAQVAALDEQRRKAQLLNPTALGNLAIQDVIRQHVEVATKAAVTAERAKLGAAVTVGVPKGTTTAPKAEVSGNEAGTKTEGTHPGAFPIDPNEASAPKSKDDGKGKRAADKSV